MEIPSDSRDSFRSGSLSRSPFRPPFLLSPLLPRQNLVEDLKPWRARAPLKTSDVLAMHTYYMREMNPATLKVCCWAPRPDQVSVRGC